jgi:hypothetical protein
MRKLIPTLIFAAASTLAALPSHAGWGFGHGYSSHGSYGHYRHHSGYYHHGYRGRDAAAAVSVGLALGLLTSPRWAPRTVTYVTPAYTVREVIEVPASHVQVERVVYDAPRARGQLFSLYCASAKAYQGVVKECPEGWQRVMVE